MRIALLHPGEMGAAVGACLVANGHTVAWAAGGRSNATAARAAPFAARPTLAASLADAQVVLSVCPPGVALELAQAVIACGYRGRYLDANAIAPATMRQIAALDGLDCVDGGIIGPPPLKAGSTRLYLGGAGAREVAALFAGTALEAITIDGDVGAASALKACYAAWTKGSTALLGAIRALAQAESVDAALVAEWNRSQPGLAARSENIVAQRHKAWRWIDEMHEIAASFETRGLPGGFHDAAAEVYARLEAFKGERDAAQLDALVAVLLGGAKNRGHSA